MAAATPPPPFLLSTLSSSSTSSSNPPSPTSQMHYFLLHHPFFSLFLFTFSLSLVILLKINKNRRTHQGDEKPSIKISSFSHPSVDINKKNDGNNSGNCNDINTDDNEEADNDDYNNNNDNKNSNKSSEFDKSHESEPTHLTHSLLLSFLPSGSAKWEKLLVDNGSCDSPERAGPGQEVERAEKGQQQNKKKKKRAKKKRPDSDNGEGESKKEEGGLGVVSECPFTTSSSATQRKIKQQYDQLVKSHQSNGLTLAQVGQFVNCLIEARNELQHKSEVIQRRFTITKALLFRADRSSFDRLRQQIYKLEIEQKRLEEDACVYNWLQQQLKLSPAYKKMLEIGACMEMKAKSSEPVDGTDAEFADISFEELLAREKKDSFWQRHRKPKQCSG